MAAAGALCSTPEGSGAAALYEAFFLNGGRKEDEATGGYSALMPAWQRPYIYYLYYYIRRWGRTTFCLP